MKPGIHVSDWGVALDNDDIEFVADALEWFATYDGCARAVQGRARLLSKIFRCLQKNKEARATKGKASRKGPK